MCLSLICKTAFWDWCLGLVSLTGQSLMWATGVYTDSRLVVSDLDCGSPLAWSTCCPRGMTADRLVLHLTASGQPAQLTCAAGCMYNVTSLPILVTGWWEVHGWRDGWLSAFLADLLVYLVDTWLTGWLTGWFACIIWLNGWLTICLPGWLACLFSGWLTGWLAWFLASWQAGFLAGWLAGWLDGSMAICMERTSPLSTMLSDSRLPMYNQGGPSSATSRPTAGVRDSATAASHAAQIILHPNKHNKSTHCWDNVGPAS